MKAREYVIGLLGLVLLGCEGRKEDPAGAGPGGEPPGVLDPVVQQEPADDPPAGEAEWISMMPKEGMGDWESISYGGEGEVTMEEGVFKMDYGADLTGVRWKGDVPEVPYEIELEARKTLGEDFFCGLTVPVGRENACVTLIVGGWGGGLVGISSIDELDASENETSSYQEYAEGEWYPIRMEVRAERLDAWIAGKHLVDVETKGRRLGLREGAIEESMPLGVSAFQTEAELRKIRWRKLR